MVLSFTVLGVFGVLFVLSARKQVPDNFGKRWILMPFYKISVFLLELRVNKVMLAHGKLIEKNLEAVQAKGNGDSFIFDVQRVAQALCIILIGTCISFAVETALNFDNSQVGYALQRPSHGEGDQEEELQAKIEGEEEAVDLSISLKEQEYTKDQEREFLKTALDQMEGWILGNNSSLDEVREKLCLNHSFMDGKIEAEWTAEPFDIFDDDGEIIGEIPEQGILVNLTAELSCGKEKGTYETFVKVLPPVYTEKERLILGLQKEVDRRNEERAEEEELELPDSVDGKAVVWSKGRQNIGGILCTLGLVAGICYFIGKDRELSKLAQKRKNQMILDYPDILFKLSMLIGAGLTLRAAFSKVVLEYKERNVKEPRYAYEEMLTAYYEMETGISETSAYENFGRRCQISGYVKLGAILAQGLKKGSDGLVQLLQNEALTSMEERKQTARKIGEEAGTKMLLPMGLMLVIVLVILMVPAVLSF